MANVNAIKLTTAEHKLAIATEALRKIANTKLTTYHKMVDVQARLAEEALAEIERGGDPDRNRQVECN